MLLKDLLNVGPSTVSETATASPHGKSDVSPLETLEKLIHDIRNPLGAIGATNRVFSLAITQEKLFHTILLQDKAITEIRDLLRSAADLHFSNEPFSRTAWTGNHREAAKKHDGK